MEKFYQLNKNEEGNELLVYGDITSYKYYEEDVCSYDLAVELSQLEGDLKVRINSYGGEVSQGLAIYNLLKSYKGKVTTMCDGFACSAASVVFMAGSVRAMPRSSLLFLHNAWTTQSGDSNALRAAADDLEKITMPSIAIYKENSNLSEEAIKNLMDDETWITADEALDYGFATMIVENQPQQAINEQYLFKVVSRNKALEKQIKDMKNQKQPDAWTSFFKGGN